MVTNSSKAFSNHGLIHQILVNGLPKEIIDNNIELTTTDNLTIILSEISDTLEYVYQCEGKDSISTTKKHSFISYTNFPVGTYPFRLSTSNKELLASDITLTIEVHKSFLGSWVFISLLLFYIILLFGGAGYFIVLSNYRNKEKLFALRNDWTSKLHNDIGADLSSVSLRINTLNKRLEKLDPALQVRVKKIYSILTSIQKNLRFVFDLVDPKKNSFEVMLLDVKLFAEENFALKQINFHFENNINSTEVHKLDIGRVNKIYLVLKEAVNNAVKHSNAENAYIKLNTIKEGILICIKDDGKGFDDSFDYDSNGIKNLIQYGKEGFLDVQINSKPNKGTEVNVLVPKL